MAAWMMMVLLQASAPAGLPDWLTGTWVMSSGSSWSEEWWTPPRGDLMLGASRSGNGPRLEFFEHMRIEKGAAGLMFCAMPKGQAGGCFPAVAGDVTSITFENRQHDYPQRIRYWREGRDLLAEISKADGSRPQRWRYRPLAP